MSSARREKPGIKIADFKAHMGRYLREVRNGHPLTLLDRNTPIARVLPFVPGAGKLVIRKAVRDPKDLGPPKPLGREVDSLKYLLKDRNSGR